MGGYSGHSWSDAPYDSSDPATYPNMWFAPQRLGTGYVDYSFEISAGTSPGAISPEQALSLWQGSPPHNDVILNKEAWSDSTWQAIGVGIYEGVAHVWFGTTLDPTGPSPVVGTPASEIVSGTNFPDILEGRDGGDTLQALGGDDRVNGGLGSDTLEGGDGRDTADYSATSMGVSVDLGFAHGSGPEIDFDYYSSIESVLGGSGNDTLQGWTGDDSLSGGDGHDTLYGKDGNDTLTGNGGDDVVVAGSGNDSVEGEAGIDTFYGQAGEDTVRGGDGNDYADGGEDSDTLEGGAGIDTLHGGLGNDSVAGGDGDDFVAGSEGNDSVDGGIGQDIILGGIGADTLFGGTDHDWDRIQSQAEGTTVADIFVLNVPGDQQLGAYDQFESFEIGVDRIRAIGAQSFADIAFSDYPGQGVKIISIPDGSAAFLLGIEQAQVVSDWFIYG